MWVFMDPRGDPSRSQLYITKFSHEWLQSCSMLSSGYLLPSHRKDTHVFFWVLYNKTWTNSGHCKSFLPSINIIIISLSLDVPEETLKKALPRLRKLKNTCLWSVCPSCSSNLKYLWELPHHRELNFSLSFVCLRKSKGKLLSLYNWKGCVVPRTKKTR